jgi:hypothetical protein
MQQCLLPDFLFSATVHCSAKQMRFLGSCQTRSPMPSPTQLRRTRSWCTILQLLPSLPTFKPQGLQVVPESSSSSCPAQQRLLHEPHHWFPCACIDLMPRTHAWQCNPLLRHLATIFTPPSMTTCSQETLAAIDAHIDLPQMQPQPCSTLHRIRSIPIARCTTPYRCITLESSGDLLHSI